MFKRKKIKTEFTITTTQRVRENLHPLWVFYSGNHNFNTDIERAKRYSSREKAVKRASQLKKEIGGLYLVQEIL